MSIPCGEWKRVNDPKCKERCGRSSVGYVISGPMFVCHQHARHHEANGEEIMRGGGW